MNLVDNREIKHMDAIKKTFKGAKEVVICVAFIKKSGLDEIRANLVSALRKGTTLTVFAGLDLYVTEPKALSDLYELTKKYKNMNLYLCHKGGSTFHPKLYFSMFNKKASLLIGSAQLNKGGLSKE